MYQVSDRETNSCVIGEFNALEEAENCVKENEVEDKNNGDFVADFYEITEIWSKEDIEEEQGLELLDMQQQGDFDQE